jgi:putative sterol carrier protein
LKAEQLESSITEQLGAPWIVQLFSFSAFQRFSVSAFQPLHYLSRMPDLFSVDGIAAWRARLDSSDAFHRAARGWSGTVLLVERYEHQPQRATYIAVSDGTLAASRPATAADQSDAEFVLEAGPDTWRGLARGELELIAAALKGALRLERGSVFRLIPHAGAAAAMLREAGGAL